MPTPATATPPADAPAAPLTPADVRAAALVAHDAGLSVFPPRQDGTKAPAGEWKEYQEHRPTRAQVEAWFSDGRTGVGWITGKVSGVEILEFDERAVYDRYVEAARATGLGDLIEQIEAGYSEDSPGGGVHWPYRCAEIAGNTKLARRPKRPEEMKHPKDLVKTLIETRGENGYIIVAPSYGSVHDSGRPYVLRRGGPANIAIIAPEARLALHDLARTFDQMPKPEHAQVSATAAPGNRPGDAWAAATTWDAILQPHGWSKVYSRDGTDYWRRPGKTVGVSATTNHAGSGLLYAFTTSTEFEAERGYGKFSAYVVLYHAGDFRAAARDLAVRGFGTPPAGAAQGAAAAAAEPIAVRDACDLAATAPPRPMTLLDPPGLLDVGEIAALHGPQGSGKSTLGIGLAGAVAAGSPLGLLRGTGHDPRPVLLVLAEYGLYRAHERVAPVVEHYRIHPGMMHVWCRADAPRLLDLAANEMRHAREIAEIVRREGVRLVVADSFTEIHNADENSRAEMKAVIDALRCIADAGAAVLLIHHDRKPPGDVRGRGAPSLADARGSGAIAAALSTAWACRMEAQDAESTSIIVAVTKANYCLPAHRVLRYRVRRDRPGLVAEWEACAATGRPALTADEVLAAMRQLGGAELRIEAVIREAGAAERCVRGIVRDLVAAGRVALTRGEHGRHLYTVTEAAS